MSEFLKRSDRPSSTGFPSFFPSHQKSIQPNISSNILINGSNTTREYPTRTSRFSAIAVDFPTTDHCVGEPLHSAPATTELPLANLGHVVPVPYFLRALKNSIRALRIPRHWAANRITFHPLGHLCESVGYCQSHFCIVQSSLNIVFMVNVLDALVRYQPIPSDAGKKSMGRASQILNATSLATIFAPSTIIMPFLAGDVYRCPGLLASCMHTNCDT